MPSGLPIAALIDALDEGPDGWVALALEHVDGRQAPLPWTDGTIAAALGSLAELRDGLTPAPVGPWADAADELRGMFDCWRQLTDAADLDPWLADRLTTLTAAGDAALIIVQPTTGPQDEATVELLHRLRAELPQTVRVTGLTAVFADISDRLADRLWVVIAFVVGVSLLLLTAALAPRSTARATVDPVSGDGRQGGQGGGKNQGNAGRGGAHGWLRLAGDAV